MPFYKIKCRVKHSRLYFDNIESCIDYLRNHPHLVVDIKISEDTSVLPQKFDNSGFESEKLRRMSFDELRGEWTPDDFR